VPLVAYEQILTEQRDDVLVLTLNRPERLNAWTPRMTYELSEAIVEAEADPSIGALVLTGAGRGFCAGADISAVFDAQLQGESGAAAMDHERDWVELLRSTKPIVAAINGPAIGLGLTMVLPCDRLIAARGAKLSVRFVKMGLVPELASSMFLPMRCGLGVASDLMLSGRTILAEDALPIGLVDEVVAPDELLDVAVARAREYGENPAPALRWIKEALTLNANETDARLAQRRELERLVQAYATPEHKAAVAAFLTR
jgi:2-(1,2-epoxy-1,2-dihydrophenyl)acetyl-CoA isomerase